MIRLFLAALLALLIPSAALANDLEGGWALRIDDANIFVFTIAQREDGEWHGTWKRPSSFASNGAVFTRLSGSQVVVSMAGLEFAGDVELSFEDTAPGAIPDIFRFRLVGPGQALLTYVGTQLPPFPLVAVGSDARLGPFERDRLYDRDNAATMPEAAGDVPEDVAPQTSAPETAPSARGGIGADFLDDLLVP